VGSQNLSVLASETTFAGLVAHPVKVEANTAQVKVSWSVAEDKDKIDIQL
jgi:hypothetical protein